MSMMEPRSDKLQYIFDNARVGIAICNAEDNTLEMVNPAFAAIHGYEPHELIGASPGEVFAPECMLRIEAHESAPSCAINDVSFETTHIRKDGSLVPVSVHITVIKDEKGVVKQRIANIQDISDRKKTESELQITHERFSQIYDNSTDVIYLITVTPEGRFIHLDINPAFVEVSGISREEIVGRYVDEFENESFRTILLEKYGSCLTAGKKTDYTNDYPLPTGIRTFHSVLTPLFDEKGRLHQIVGIARDITEHKQIEHKLLTSEDKYRTFFESANDGIFLHRIVEQNGTVEFMLHDLNQRGCELWDHSKEDILSGNLDLLTIGEHPYTFEEATRRNRLAASGEPQLFDWQIKHKDGSKIWGEVNLRRIEIENEPFLLAIIRDITERKQSEQRLQQAIELNEEIINTIPDLLFELDAAGTYLTIWAQDETLLAMQKAILIGNNVRKILPPDALEVTFKTIREVDETGQSLGNTMYIDLPEGRKYFELSASKKKSSGTYIVLSREITERKEQELKLQKTKAKLTAVISTIPDLIWVKDADGVYMLCNPAFENFFGAECDEIVGKTDYDFISRSQADFFRQKDLEVMEAREMRINEEEIVFAHNGQRALLETRKIPVYNGKEFMGILGIGHDITEKKRMELLIFQNESRLKEAQKIAKVGSWELEFPSYRLQWSDEIYRIFEIDQNQFQPSYEYFLSAIHPDDRDYLDTVFNDSIKNKTPYDFVHRLLMRDGRIKYVHEIGQTTYDTEGNPIRSIGTVQDITERKSIEKKMHHMAHHDALTGLPNRTLAKERAKQIMTQAKRSESKAAFLFIDLDGFKAINDTLGHSVGDLMLKSVSSRLKESLRESDALSRQGGDEFLLILSGIQNNDSITSIAQKILAELEKPFEINSHTLSLSGSIGIALYPDHGETFEALLQSADTAMYKAKETGKNGYHFYSQQMTHHMIGQFKIQNDLKNALENNEFILFYQPQIDLATHRIIGVEALIRWRHPMMGMMPPMSFIPIAESSGLIVQIGQWVIEESCRQVALWQKMGIDISVAVNISAMQFKRGNLEEIVINALQDSQINPKWLELELTESIIMHDADNTLQSVRNLKELGVQLSIDDFGTGYSSLSYLKRFAVDKLKIDQSFVRDILQDQDDAAIVKTIIQMAKNLNLTTIAEGVENQEVLSIIQDFGCDEVQGYHFAKPMPSGDFELYHTNFYGEKS